MKRLSLLPVITFLSPLLLALFLIGGSIFPVHAQRSRPASAPFTMNTASPTSTTALSATTSVTTTNVSTVTANLLDQGIDQYDRGEYDQAQVTLQKALAAAAEEQNRQDEGAAWLYLGHVFVTEDDVDSARDAFERSAAIWESELDYSHLLETLRAIGELHLTNENLEQAETTFTAAQALAQEIGDAEAEATITKQLAQVVFARHFDKYTEELAIARQASQGDKAASLLKKIGDLYRGINELDQALAAYEEEVEFRRELKQTDKVADALKAIGRIKEARAQFIDAAADYAAAADIWQELKESEKAATLYKDTGSAYRKGERYTEAAAAYAQEIPLRQLIKDERGEAEASHNLSEAWLAAGQVSEAEAALTNEIALWLNLHEVASARDAQVALAALYEAQANYENAQVAYTTAISLTRGLDDQKLLADLLTDFSDLNVGQGNGAAAAAGYEEALTLWQALEQPNDELKVLRRLADLYRDQQQPEKAIAYLVQALPLATAGDDPKTTAKLYGDLGAAYHDTAAIEKSREAYQAALQRWQALGDQQSIMDTLKAIGDIYYREQQDYVTALDYFSQALEIAQSQGLQDDEAYFLRRVGDSYEKQEQYKEALTQYHQSRDLWLTLGEAEEAAKVDDDIAQVEADLAEQQLALRTENGLVAPIDGATISGTVDVRGLANDDQFQKWQLDLLIDQDPNRATFLEVSRRAAPAVKRLMELDTTLYPNGVHTLRLRVVRTDFNYDEYMVSITIDN